MPFGFAQDRPRGSACASHFQNDTTLGRVGLNFPCARLSGARKQKRRPPVGGRRLKGEMLFYQMNLKPNCISRGPLNVLDATVGSRKSLVGVTSTIRVLPT